VVALGEWGWVVTGSGVVLKGLVLCHALEVLLSLGMCILSMVEGVLPILLPA
jgi:hypothetical protein